MMQTDWRTPATAPAIFVTRCQPYELGILISGGLGAVDEKGSVAIEDLDRRAVRRQTHIKRT
jgi:hypothetical protein